MEPIDLAAASDDDLRALAAVGAALERAAGIPDVLIPPPAAGVVEWRFAPAYAERRAFVVRDGSDVVGSAVCRWEDLASNRDHVHVWIEVHPEYQGRGFGRRLLTATVQAARDEFDARIIDTEARRDEIVPRRFLESLGFESRLTSPRNVAWTRDIDRSTLEAWVARVSERASDYELLTWDGPMPDEHTEDFVRLWHVMNTAPKEGLDREDDVVTVREARLWEEYNDARGITPWAVVARHIPSGQLAGFTVLALSPHWPRVAEQQDTGVLPEHRNRGLGRWVKAINALRLLAEHPEVEALCTWNAGSNQPMLAINHAMAFAPVEWWAEWQAEAKRLRELLGSAG